MTEYDDNNIFARILRGEIPSTKIYENDHAVAIKDVNPNAPIHILVLTKGKHRHFADFSANASDAEMAGYTKAIGEAARIAGAEEGGYRLISNSGANAHQEVPHLHMHVLGGRSLGAKLVRDAD